MTKYGTQFSATDALKKSAGESHNAGLRVYRNHFDLATQGGTAEALKIAELAAGDVVESLTIDTDANVSAVNFSWGTGTDAVKYGAAVAGPNATQQTRYAKLTLALNPATGREEILLTPSANLPGAGLLRTTLRASHR